MPSQIVQPAAQTGVKDFLTIGCAVLGATLGILNTVVGLNQRRVKLRVTPSLCVRSEHGAFTHKTELLPNGSPAIEVINLSAFPITVTEAGFRLKGETGRLIPVPPFILDNKPWPRRLDSRDSVTVYFSSTNKFPKNIGVAYAKTSCETTRYGNSPALKKFRAHLQKELQ